MDRRCCLRSLAATTATAAAIGLATGLRPPSTFAAGLEDLFQLGESVLDENLDPQWRQWLETAQDQDWSGLLGQAVEALQGYDVLELADFAEAARAALPFLESDPETRPYAAWLRAHSDYFDVADTLRETLPRPATPPGKPPARPVTPTPNQERKAWESQVKTEPAPRSAAALVPRLKPVLKKAGAPPELVWLAEIESDFSPAARSPSGAVGLFQLMPRTASGLGLKLRPRDERLDPEKSTHAAGTYLRQLHSEFRDWPLALAAYNAGPGRVREVLRKRRALSYDSAAPGLPAETQMYVPRFEAVLKKREGVTLQRLRLPVAA